MDFMRERYPQVVLTFNSSILEDLRWSHYVCFETHGIKQTWAQVKQYRNWKRPWELVSPAAANWDAPQPKRNQVENALTAAIIMAAGGKVNFGIASEMDGSFHPEVVKAALRAVRDRGSLVVRVNPRDHELARAAVEIEKALL
jgi:hypothetical protein